MAAPMAIPLQHPAPLDPDFAPCALWNRAVIGGARNPVPLVVAVEGEDGRISRHETVISAEPDAAALLFAERLVKMLLWARGGWRVVIGGPPAVAEHVRALY